MSHTFKIPHNISMAYINQKLATLNEPYQIYPNASTNICELLNITTLVLFIGNAETSGITDVDGSGELPVKTSGSAEWLIIPYSEAAPYEDQAYEIGGILYYTVNGQNITVPLFPDSIQVTPDPRLYLNYFLERYVKSDDALTEGKRVYSIFFIFREVRQ